MNYHGWAFGVRDGQMTREQISARYNEIKHLRKDFKWSGESKYAHNTWRAEAQTEEAAALSAMDVMILADQGNLCFGGTSSSFTSQGVKTFSGTYNTD